MKTIERVARARLSASQLVTAAHRVEAREVVPGEVPPGPHTALHDHPLAQLGVLHVIHTPARRVQRRQFREVLLPRGAPRGPIKPQLRQPPLLRGWAVLGGHVRTWWRAGNNGFRRRAGRCDARPMDVTFVRRRHCEKPPPH
eukprot:1191136-Prorocentrum_minimum.AAC.7